ALNRLEAELHPAHFIPELGEIGEAFGVIHRVQGRRGRTSRAPRATKSGRHFDVGRIGVWLGHVKALQPQTFQMKLHRLSHISLDVFPRLAGRHAAFQVGRVGKVSSTRLFDHNKILLHCFSPACFRMLFSVPRASSSLWLPGTVTKPRFAGCLYWWWLPRVLARYQPSSWSRLTRSRTFPHQR